MSIPIDVFFFFFFFFAFGLPTKTTICILKKLYDTFKIGKIALGFGHFFQKYWQLYNYFIFSHCTARMAETSDSEEELFLTQSSFNGSSIRGNEFASGLQKCSVTVEEETEGLFSFDHSDEHQEVSIGSGCVWGEYYCNIHLGDYQL